MTAWQIQGITPSSSEANVWHNLKQIQFSDTAGTALNLSAGKVLLNVEGHFCFQYEILVTVSTSITYNYNK